MDATSLTRKSQRQKRENEEDINCSGRSLSELPDDVLLHIISFLPTKEAVRTSILSKRWKYLWASIPKLDFVQGHTKTVDFTKFVVRAFLLHGSSDINKFYLNSEVDVSCHLDAWISTAVKCNVQECELELDGIEEALSLPLSLVNCGTLTCLRVEMSGMLKLPSPICLSNLKKLELNYVEFPDDHSTQQLFSGCPVLEDLSLGYCDWVNVTAVCIFSPRLRNLTLIEAPNADSNVSRGYEFVILGSGLECLYYSGEFHFQLCIFSTALLEEVELHIYPVSSSESSRHLSYRLLMLLKSITNVSNLILEGDSALLLVGKPELLNHIPIFTRLKCLELDYNTSDLTNVVLLKILQNIPCLKSLQFSEGIKISSADASEDRILNPVPPCFLYHLNFIFVYIRDGNEMELNVVKVLHDNALVLTEMAIEFAPIVAEDVNKKFCEELLEFPSASDDCEFLFHGGALD